MKHSVMILSGGTAGAWHMCQVLRAHFEGVRVVLCDCNPPHLVAAALLADLCIQVPMICEDSYYQRMLEILDEEKPDLLIPLIDHDLLLFPQDNPDLLRRGIHSTAACKKSGEILSNKRHMCDFLKDIEIATPMLYAADKVEENRFYYIKKAVGFGSRGARKQKGSEIRTGVIEDEIIQEYCFPPEITVDALYTGKTLHCVCRERIEVKAGVCTKARIFFEEEIQETLEKIAAYIQLPALFCVQFMQDEGGRRLLTDFNLRIGGGTALSAAAGFQAARAAFMVWLDDGEPGEDWLKTPLPLEERFVLRTYQEWVSR